MSKKHEFSSSYWQRARAHPTWILHVLVWFEEARGETGRAQTYREEIAHRERWERP